MNLRYTIAAAAVSAALLMTGCVIGGGDPPKPPVTERAFLMYDNINNEPGQPFTGNIGAAGGAVAAGALDEAEKVVVYERLTGGNVIYELVKDATAALGFTKTIVKKYTPEEFEELTPAEAIAKVVRDVRTLVPANRYGMAFGSHGRGWVPKASTVAVARDRAATSGATPDPLAEVWDTESNGLTRYLFGYNEKIDVDEFADALDEWEWDFVLLDDCFMASVEALYEIRRLTDYFIASPTEVLMAGFPYDRVVRTLFEVWERDLERSMEGVADDFVEAYRTGAIGSAPCATVAVVRTAGLEELAETVRRMNLKINEASAVEGIQFYENMSNPGHLFYDLGDYLGTVRGGTAEYNAFAAQMARTVVFKDHTEKYLSAYSGGSAGKQMPIDPAAYSGLNVFIPWSQTAAFVDMYRTTAWYRDVYAQE